MTTRAKLLATAMLLGLCTEARADIITYTETVTATGAFGGNVFTDALVTLTQTANAGDVVVHPTFAMVAAVSSTVTVAGTGTPSFSFATAVYDTPGLGVGVGVAGPGGTIIFGSSAESPCGLLPMDGG